MSCLLSPRVRRVWWLVVQVGCVRLSPRAVSLFSYRSGPGLQSRHLLALPGRFRADFATSVRPYMEYITGPARQCPIVARDLGHSQVTASLSFCDLPGLDMYERSEYHRARVRAPSAGWGLALKGEKK